VARDWDDLFLVARGRRGASTVPDDVDDPEGGRASGLARLRASLRATRQALGTGVAAGFSKPLADHDWEALEESLILADVGAPAAAEISQSLEATVRRERLDSDALRARLVELLAEQARGRDQDGQPLQATIDLRPQPTVVLMVGVNGTGKTTTLGKLAWQIQHRLGLRVLLAAATRSALPRPSSSQDGRSGQDARSSLALPARTPARSHSRPSFERGPRPSTSSSSTRPGGCTTKSR